VGDSKWTNTTDVLADIYAWLEAHSGLSHPYVTTTSAIGAGTSSLNTNTYTCTTAAIIMTTMTNMNGPIQLSIAGDGVAVARLVTGELAVGELAVGGLTRPRLCHVAVYPCVHPLQYILVCRPHLYKHQSDHTSG
jgi:hypothetical protein